MKKKTIITIITLGLVTLLGFGFLGGINYQPKEAKASEITLPTKKYSKVIDLNTILNNDNIYYFVAKNYEQNGAGVFYEGSINLTNSAVVTMNNASLGTQLNFTEIRDSDKTPTSLSFVSAMSAGVYHIKDILISRGNDYVNTYLYHATDTGGYFKRDLAGFIGTQLFIRNNTDDCLWYVNKFFNIYQLQDIFYEFGEINPYTYWNVAKNSPYVNFTTLDGSSLGLSHKDIKVSSFYVGGLAFDYIRLYYIGLQAGDHFNINGEQFIYQGNADTYMTFSHAVFYNSVTNYQVKFFQQEVTYGSFGYEGLTYLGSFNYTNLNFKILQFFEPLNSTMINNLDALSNVNQNIGYHSTSDIGLGNAFALISQAFTAWVPILSISVIPGITLGMLMFLPLIAGIIIFIIWIVKR